MPLPEIGATMSRLFSCNMTSIVDNDCTGSDKLGALHTNPYTALWKFKVRDSLEGYCWCCDADALFVQVP